MPDSPPSPFSVRGTIEGFYGPPWSHDERLRHLAFCADVGLDTVMYAPKDDPYHRERWREPYPPAELARIAQLARRGAELGVRFLYALHPALNMRFGDDAEVATLLGKAAQLHDAGVTSFALLFDDVPLELGDAGDVARFGPGGAGLGAAHGTTSRRFAEEFLAARALPGPLIVCPTDYAGVDPSPYRDGFAATAPDDVVLTWTGTDVVVGAVTRADIDRAAASYRRPLILWDNFPVNDFEPSRLFLGPLLGRTSDVEGSALVGVLANAMIQAEPSQLPLASVADWARDPGGYDPVASAGSALRRVAGAGADALAPLVRVCSTWPPSRDQDPELTGAVAGALAGSSAALDVLDARLTELARSCRAAREPAVLIAALQPWLDGAAATADAGLAAAALLRALDNGADVGDRPVLVRAALDRAEEHYANVLRPIVPPFVRAVLDRAGATPEPGSRGVVVLLTGPRDDVTGDRGMAELLATLGFTVRRSASADPAGLDDAVLVVVSNTTPAPAGAALRSLAVPIVAWGGFVELGLASGVDRPMSFEPLVVDAPDDPLAAGLSGPVAVFRGAARMTVGTVGPAARVIGRGPAGAPALFRYAVGDALVDGTPAPAPRVGLFLGIEGAAPWLLAPAGRALVTAALTRDLDTARPEPAPAIKIAGG